MSALSNSDSTPRHSYRSGNRVHQSAWKESEAKHENAMTERPRRHSRPVESEDVIAGIITDLVLTEKNELPSHASHRRHSSKYSHEYPLEKSDDQSQILHYPAPRYEGQHCLEKPVTPPVPSQDHFSRGDCKRPEEKKTRRGSKHSASVPKQESERGRPTSDSMEIHTQSEQQFKHSSLSRTPSAYRDANMESEELLQPESASIRSGHQGSQGQRPPSAAAESYPSPAKTAVIMLSLYISIFLVALDRTIMGPAIPAITNQFHSLPDVGWYGSAYMLTSCGFILLYGRVYTFFPTKPVFLSGIALFEIGSALCGAANSSLVLIIGRAIAGLGSSGIFTGAILIMLNTVPLHKRPMLQGLFGACFGVASVAGPLLGGAFTGSKATWRWCFYINLPLGGITILVVVLLLRLEEEKPKLNSWKDLDPLGSVLFLPSITCLLLALEWGAADYAWSDKRIVALLAVFASLFVAFALWQYYTRHTSATVPARILLQRSVACGSASQFCVGAAMLSVVMYVPLWFQAIQGVDAMQSGIRLIPLVLSVVVGSISSGGLVQRSGYYVPFMIAGACLMSAGAGLITTWTHAAKSGKWIGYQVLFGLGVGWTMQHPNLAVQIVLAKQDVPTGTALLSLFQTLGGAIFVSVGQNLFIDKFTSGLRAIPGINVEKIVHVGATKLTHAVAPKIRPQVLDAYNKSLTQGPFFAALIVACLALPAAMGMEWRSVKEGQQPHPQAPIADEEKTGGEPHTQSMAAFADEGSDASESVESELVSPVQAWKKAYRSSGQFSQWMTAQVNPDLRSELERVRVKR